MARSIAASRSSSIGSSRSLAAAISGDWALFGQEEQQQGGQPEIDHVPDLAHDQRLDLVLTEREIIDCRG